MPRAGLAVGTLLVTPGDTNGASHSETIASASLSRPGHLEHIGKPQPRPGPHHPTRHGQVTALGEPELQGHSGQGYLRTSLLSPGLGQGTSSRAKTTAPQPRVTFISASRPLPKLLRPSAQEGQDLWDCRMGTTSHLPALASQARPIQGPLGRTTCVVSHPCCPP